jgi:predicted Zn finger-like uncharacterized protein
MFKVVPDQLRISEGWVRCGHCAEIFDATADLQDESQVALPPVEPPPAEVEHTTAPSALDATEADDDPSGASGYGFSVHSEVPRSEIEGAPDPVEIDEQVAVLREDPLDQPFLLRRADDGDETAEDSRAIGPHGFSQPTPLQPEPELHDLSFVRQARRREFWQRTTVRIAMALFAVALAALLAGQVAYADRDRLAATNPSLRPWLGRMCDALRCRIGPPRLVDSVAIETSSFNKLRGDTYRLSVTLKNLAPIQVAMPALELTLTDSQDQAVLRRVLQPGEFAPNAPAIGPRSDWSTSLAIAVNAAAAGGRIAGYRVLAFYP